MDLIVAKAHTRYCHVRRESNVMRKLLGLFGLTVALVSVASVATSQCLIPSNLIVSGGPGKDGIPALTNPSVVPADVADSFLLPDDQILGVVVNGEARAYPHAVLWWHEIINDVLGGRPILVTFCPLTGSGIVHDPIVNGQELNFGVSGLLFDNNLIMFDRATDSLWSQMSLQSICGDLTSTRAPLLPVVQTTWAAWKGMRPETTAVSFETGFSRNYDLYPYGDYDSLESNQLLFPQTSNDPRLPMKENVLGITQGEVSRAYSMTRMALVAPRRAINDVVNGRSVLVAFDAGASLAIPFDRSLEDGTILEFDVVAGEGFPFTLQDRQTGSVWSLGGVSVSGPLVGERLVKIPTFTSFWFAWSSFNAGTEIFEFAVN